MALSPWPSPLIALTRIPKVSALQIALGPSKRTPELRVGGLDTLRTDLQSLNARLRDDRLPGRALRVESALPDILGEVDRRTLVSRSGVLLLTIQSPGC